MTVDEISKGVRDTSPGSSGTPKETSPYQRIENIATYVEALPVPPIFKNQMGHLFMHMELEWACKKTIPYNG